MNKCVFSPDRVYRYTLEHSWNGLFPKKAIQWIGLNPSTANEHDLDPTLRRIKAFSTAWGYNAFVMTNLFAFRATDPKDMMAALSPIGSRNDVLLSDTLDLCDKHVVAAWGTGGSYMDRDKTVTKLLQAFGAKVVCLGLSKEGHPRHPLYVKGDVEPVRYFH